MDRVGPYVIDRKLGTGGMGTVYLAVHEETGQRAAVKVLPASLAREEGFRARFEREIASMRQIENPHVVKVYESGAVEEGSPDEQAWYYAMEYVDGETLLSKLRNERRLPWETVIDYGVQVCSALKAAHDAGIVHRDLKPSNLLVSKEGMVKLVDFGVAQVFASSRLTKSGGIIGTAEFMSPEQAQGQRATKKSDLYSLGAVLYTMLTGKPPYSGQTMLDVLHKHRFGQYDRPRHYAPECPIWLEEVVCQLLEKDPDKRPADAYVTGKRLREIPKKIELSRSEPLPVESLPVSRTGPPTGQEILSHEEDAAGGEPQYDADAPTRTAPGLTGRDTPATPRGPGEATLMHALMREEVARQQQRHPVQEFFENTWVLLGLLALLLLGGWFWYHSLPTPERHWAEAERLVAAKDYSTARIDHLQPLLKEDPPWPRRAQERILEVRALERLEAGDGPVRNVRRPRGLAGAGSSALPDSEAARILRRAENLRDAGDAVAAARTLEALLAVTTEADGSTVRAAAKRLLSELGPNSVGDGERKELIRSALARAAALRAGKPEEADAIYRGLLTLYGDDASLASLLEPARRAIDGAAPQ